MRRSVENGDHKLTQPRVATLATWPENAVLAKLGVVPKSGSGKLWITRLYSGILNSEAQNGRSGIDLITTIIEV